MEDQILLESHKLYGSKWVLFFVKDQLREPDWEQKPKPNKKQVLQPFQEGSDEDPQVHRRPEKYA